MYRMKLITKLSIGKMMHTNDRPAKKFKTNIAFRVRKKDIKSKLKIKAKGSKPYNIWCIYRLAAKCGTDRLVLADGIHIDEHSVHIIGAAYKQTAQERRKIKNIS